MVGDYVAAGYANGRAARSLRGRAWRTRAACSSEAMLHHRPILCRRSSADEARGPSARLCAPTLASHAHRSDHGPRQVLRSRPRTSYPAPQEVAAALTPSQTGAQRDSVPLGVSRLPSVFAFSFVCICWRVVWRPAGLSRAVVDQSTCPISAVEWVWSSDRHCSPQ